MMSLLLKSRQTINPDNDKERDLILILDFGSQYTQLIARRIRELGIFSLVKPFNISASKTNSIKS